MKSAVVDRAIIVVVWRRFGQSGIQCPALGFRIHVGKAVAVAVARIDLREAITC